MFLFKNKCILYNYADDNSLSCAATTVQEVISSLQFDRSRVIQWFTDNGMQANLSKFQLMLISPGDDCAQRLGLNGNTVLVSEKTRLSAGGNYWLQAKFLPTCQFYLYKSRSPVECTGQNIELFGWVSPQNDL